MTTSTTNGTVAQLESAAIKGLQARLQGTLVAPEDTAYEPTRAIWNGMIDRRPALIARCLGTADVLACVDFAREHGVPLSIRGGGHNISGLAVQDDALMIDLSLMRGVWVDPSDRLARAQPGCLLGDVDRETQIHGLAAVLGFVSMTGIAGLTLGGGFGYLSRRFGWTCDNVRSMQVVTADGRVVQASEQENSDLFWGLCGGGGNFGVVTGFEYRLHPVGPEIIGGAIAWREEEIPDVLDLYRRLAAEAPPEMACVLGLRLAPPAPWIDPAFHGKPIAALFVCYTGSLKDGEDLVAPIKSFGSPIGDIIGRRTYLSQQSLLDATQPKGRRYYWKSEYLPNIEPELLARGVTHARKVASPHGAVLLFPLDGAINRFPTDYSAVGNRDASVVLNIAAGWDSADDDAANIEWARSAWDDLRAFSTGGTYINFLTEEEGEDRIRAAYGSNYEQLVAVKTRWDPENLFRMNKNIVPQV